MRIKPRLTSLTLVVAALLLTAVGVAACSRASGDWMTTAYTTLFPSQLSFREELSGDGYQAVMVLTEQEGDTMVRVVWVVVDPDKVTRATYGHIYDQAVTLAKKYGAAESTGGRLRVALSDAAPGQFIADHIFESRDFSISSNAS